MSFFFFNQKTAYEMRISDWSSDVCSSDLAVGGQADPLDVALADDLARLQPLPQHRHLGQRQGAAGDRQAGLRLAGGRRDGQGQEEIGRAACRERVWQYV